MKSTAIDKIICQALGEGHGARAIKNVKPGFRKHHPLGSTFSPSRVVIINDIGFSIAAARQYLAGKNQRDRV